jgi:hypothetical protein
MQYGDEKIIKSWPKDSRDTIEIVLDKYGVSRTKQHQVFFLGIANVLMIYVIRYQEYSFDT